MFRSLHCLVHYTCLMDSNLRWCMVKQCFRSGRSGNCDVLIETHGQRLPPRKSEHLWAIGQIRSTWSNSIAWRHSCPGFLSSDLCHGCNAFWLRFFFPPWMSLGFFGPQLLFQGGSPRDWWVCGWHWNQHGMFCLVILVGKLMSCNDKI
mgnify:CR=1 FL=1